MSRVFMVFAASGENLFEARCGAKDFFDSLSLSLVRERLFSCSDLQKRLLFTDADSL